MARRDLFADLNVRDWIVSQVQGHRPDLREQESRHLDASVAPVENDRFVWSVLVEHSIIVGPYPGSPDVATDFDAEGLAPTLAAAKWECVKAYRRYLVREETAMHEDWLMTYDMERAERDFDEWQALHGADEEGRER